MLRLVVLQAVRPQVPALLSQESCFVALLVGPAVGGDHQHRPVAVLPRFRREGLSQGGVGGVEWLYLPLGNAYLFAAAGFAPACELVAGGHDVRLLGGMPLLVEAEGGLDIFERVSLAADLLVPAADFGVEAVLPGTFGTGTDGVAQYLAGMGDFPAGETVVEGVLGSGADDFLEAFVVRSHHVVIVVVHDGRRLALSLLRTHWSSCSN